MLVLTRRIDEEIIIRCPTGEIVTITLMSAFRGQSRIGLHAHKSVQIHRREIWDKIVAEKDSEGAPHDI